MIKKITSGFVIQTFDPDTKRCVAQEFVAGDQVDWEDEAGDAVEPLDGEEYQPFTMVVSPNPDKALCVIVRSGDDQLCVTGDTITVFYEPMAHIELPGTNCLEFEFTEVGMTITQSVGLEVIGGEPQRKYDEIFENTNRAGIRRIT